MRLKYIKRALLSASLLLPLAALTSCQDDMLQYGTENSPGEGMDDALLSFRISTRAEGEESFSGDFNSYIDPDNIRVLFFDTQDKFLFEVNKRNIQVQEGDDDMAVVRLRRSELYSGLDPDQRAAAQYFIEGIGQLEGNPAKGFKIASLVNWPQYVYDVIEEADGDGDPDIRAKKLFYNKLFKFGDPLSDIYHIVYDNIYADPKYAGYDHVTMNIEGRECMDVYAEWVHNYLESKSDAKKFIRFGADGNAPDVSEEAYHGVKWSIESEKDFKDRYGNFRTWDYTRTANTETDMGLGLPGHYGVTPTTYTIKDAWHLWNFNGEVIYEHDKEGDYCGPLGVAYWQERNKNLGQELIDANTGGSFDADGIYFQATTNNRINVGKIDGNRDKVVVSINTSRNQPTKRDINNPLTEDVADGAIRFRIYGEGTLSITYRPAGEGQTSDGQERYVRVMEHNGMRFITDTHPDLCTGTKPKLNSPLGEITQVPEGYGYDGYRTVRYKVTPNSDRYTDVYIYCNGLTYFAEIDFVKDYYAYDTDRTGILPSKEYPIPMYGIQLFDPITYWPAEVNFDLSNDPVKGQDENGNDINYDIRSIFLLRSLAKIELHIPKRLNLRPTHVYMISANRTARCIPRDASTPTEMLWYGWRDPDRNTNAGAPHSNKKLDFTQEKYDFYKERMGAGSANPKDYDNSEYFGWGVTQEIENIREKGEICDGINSDRNYYFKKTGWNYGAWFDWWTENAFNNLVSEADVAALNTAQLPYPRILNTRVHRSNYIRFIEVGSMKDPDGNVYSANDYYNYILYVPEKNLDDADDQGNVTTNPKIAHIELRFDGISEEDNIDDLGSYRMYFLHKDSPLWKQNHHQIENYINNNRDKMKDLYPIMRNTIYTFTVTNIDRSTASGDVNFQICGAANRYTYSNIVFK